MALALRKLSPEEQETIEKLAHSRTASARLVERARIILLASQGHRVPAIAQRLTLTAITVRTWGARASMPLVWQGWPTSPVQGDQRPTLPTRSPK
jgi:transposase